MSSTSTLLLFLGVTVPLVLFPGPSVAFILTTGLRGGRRAGLSAMAGVETGYLVHVVAAGCRRGLGAARRLRRRLHRRQGRRRGVAAVAGVAGGAQHQRADPGRPATARRRRPTSQVQAFRQGLLVGALNPKTAVFFVAFLPQFVDPAAGPVWVQLVVLGVLFIGLASIPDALWAVVGGSLVALAPNLRLRVVDRFAGGVYAALAVLTLSARRAT